MNSNSNETAEGASLSNALLYRYKFPEDRFNFWRWVEARGPGNKRPYWYFNGEKNTLILELRKGEKRMAYDLTKQAMDLSVQGWRQVVAQALLQVRRALRDNVELTGWS